ncbi:MAG TPA: Ig-like domain-containing protein, partial [Kofleriaceae bacterium]|nr:Ig-like domain-containing protein [Kofleriaceae bacterium]
YIPEICWTVAQETAHGFGLDHEYLCEDPMTYRTDCSDTKWFRDIDAPCGEGGPRSCSCGGSTQNSYRMISDHFGKGPATPPVVSISAPADGQEVDRGYPVRADAADDIEVSRVELWINSKLVGEVTAPPYVFNAPTDVSDGRHLVEVRAYDLYGGMAVDTVAAIQGEPCSSADQCAGDETCVDGRCVPGPGSPGGLGETCASNDDCASALCGDVSGEKYCAERCEIGAGGCPDGFGCREAGDFGVCWPGYDDGGGCSAAGGAGALPPVFLGLLALLGLVRRRR